MSQEDMVYLIEIFRKLKQWRDEQRIVDHESMIRTGAVIPSQEQARDSLKRERDLLFKLSETIPLIEPMFPDFFVASQIYCRVEGNTKADFSAAVEKVAKILNESPNISVNPGEYIAEFPDHLVHVYLPGASDCKLIEVEEIVKKTVKRPHPSCLSALQVLEEIV